MADRTVSVKLKADISEYTAQLAKAAAATRGLGKDVEKSVDRDIGPAMSRSGEKSGGLLARGINQGVMRNSPLIVAGVTAALAAGAPVLLAGASVLFAGIGGAAAAQTTQVRESWADMWDGIRDGAVSDASSLVPVYEGMADKIGAAFQRMRPELRDAFQAAGPQIDSFTDSLTQAAENALPGLVRAVERGGPVIEALGSLMESVGTGISDMFDAMSDNNADAAGEALAAIGDALEEALPLLGELLGTGAEVAADVLPAVVAGLKAAHSVLEFLGPALAPVVSGFIAFKAVSTAAAYLDTFALSANRATVAMTGSATAGSRMGTAIGGVAKSLPLLAAATMGVMTAYQEGEAEQRRFGAAVTDAYARLGEGGETAAQARHELEVLKEVSERFNGSFLGMGADLKAEYETAKAAARDLAAEERNLELAAAGVTAAMLDQVEATLAAANSDLAYRMAADATEDAVTALALAQSDATTTADQLDDASMAVETAILRQAEAARQAAFDTSKATSEAGKNAEADAIMLAELLKLQSTMGASFPAALNTTIARLQGSTNAGKVASAQFANLGLTIESVPNSKTVIVSSTTPEQIRQLEALGFKVRTLPDGRVEVVALTSAAENAINYVARNRVSTVTVKMGAQYGSARMAENWPMARGGIAHAYASGGFEPMRGGIAQVVKPNTMRIIGDRVRDDEAYIPINNDARSHEILRQTAERMGYGLGREFSGGGGAGSVVNVAAPDLSGMRISGTLMVNGLEARMEGIVDQAMDSVVSGLAARGVRP